MLMKVKYLQPKDGMLRFRRRVPKHLVGIIGRGPLWTAALGLTVDQQAKAPQRVELENRKFELAMKRAV